ncbi:MAG: DUF1993 domain-containing protein [Lysobacterales bacterium]
MTHPLYAVSVPPLTHGLLNLSAILSKAQAHAAAQGYDAELLLQQRLIVDMFPLSRQIQIAADFVRGVPARLAGVEVLSIADNQSNLAEMQALIQTSVDFARGIDPALFDSAASRIITLRPGTPKERRFHGQDYLIHYGLPNFYFHLTTAYAILRSQGVPIGKPDFLGALPTL